MNKLLLAARRTTTGAPMRSAGAPLSGRTAFGVPVFATSATAGRLPARAAGWGAVVRRPAGDAIDDLIRRMADDPGYQPSESDINGLGGSSSPQPDLDALAGIPESQLTDRERARVAERNMALINLGSRVIGETASTISSAITSGNQVEIARINAASREAVARLAAEAAQAARAGNTSAAEQALRDADNARQLQTLTAVLQSSNNTKMYLMIGGAAVLGLGAIWFFTRGRGGARRNPSHDGLMANPVMEKTVRSRSGRRRHTKKYVKPSGVARARRRGWRKAR